MNDTEKYDVVILHDVIEHVHNKKDFLDKAVSCLGTDGILHVGFPAWQMPFGGHQQIARNKYIAHAPFIHLLPMTLYRSILRKAGEEQRLINELADIKECRVSIEHFKRIVRSLSLHPVDEKYYFINPHYEIKFGLKPRLLPRFLTHWVHIRNYFTTSYFCIIKQLSHAASPDK